MDNETELKEPKRTAADALAEIEAKLSTLDGIATSDAFRLGGLVREYGELKAGDATMSIMKPLLGAFGPPSKKDSLDKPWL